MKVIMYMAISANGLIARDDDTTDWISKQEWDSYSDMACNAGCLIVGRKTYGILIQEEGFSKLKDVNIVVVSKSEVVTNADNHIVADSPKDALKKLQKFETIVVAGGGSLNASFMKQGLVDEVYLDIEPIFLGQGIPLFEKEDFDVSLELLGSKMLSKNEIQLHYRIV